MKVQSREERACAISARAALAYLPCTDMMFKGPVIEIDPSCIAR